MNDPIPTDLPTLLGTPSPPPSRAAISLNFIKITITNLLSSSPHFRAAVSGLDQGLRTGLLGGFVRSLGLPEEAGLGVVPFLRAIQEKASRERAGSGSSGGGGGTGENMETD